MRCLKWGVFMVLVFVSAATGCQRSHTAPQLPSPDGYNFNVYQKIKLPMELDEISGLSYYAKDSSLFAITDNEGSIFKIYTDKRIGVLPFAEKDDYEDVARVDSTLYVMKSTGDLYSVTYQNDTLRVDLHEFPQKGNEFEILYYDDRAQKLILICKDCEADKKKALTTFSFDPQNLSFSDSSFIIKVTSIDSVLGTEKTKFKPSAAAISPVDSMVYIISSINKLLVVTTRDGEVKQVVPVHPRIFKQPEGMTFNTRGDLIISNEFAETETAELLIFRFSNNGKNKKS